MAFKEFCQPLAIIFFKRNWLARLRRLAQAQRDAAGGEFQHPFDAAEQHQSRDFRWKHRPAGRDNKPLFIELRKRLAHAPSELRRVVGKLKFLSWPEGNEQRTGLKRSQHTFDLSPSTARRLIIAATYPAPNPLSMLTTVTFEAHEFN